MTRNSYQYNSNIKTSSSTKATNLPSIEELNSLLPNSETERSTTFKRDINCLCIEVLQEIFLNVDTWRLFELRLVCSLWNNLVKKRLFSKKPVMLSNERRMGELCFWCRYYRNHWCYCHFCYSDMQRMPSVLRNAINTSNLTHKRRIGYVWVFEGANKSDLVLDGLLSLD